MSVPSRAVTITSRDGTRISARLREHARSCGTVVICHGMGDHSGRYSVLVPHLFERGLSVLLFDFRGHGESAGPRGHVNSFEEYLDDLDAALRYLSSSHPAEPVFLLGHSMGGVIVTQYLLTRVAPRSVRGIVLSSPGFELGFKVSLLKRVASRILLRCAPGLRVESGIRVRDLTSIHEAQRAYEMDPFTYSAISARWYDEFQRAAANCRARADGIDVPLLVCIGAMDQVIAPAAARRFVDKAGSKDKTLRSWEDQRHELLNDTKGDEVAQSIAQWVSERAAT